MQSQSTYDDVLEKKNEGKTTKQIERVTSRVPSGTFLAFAFGSIAASATLFVMDRKQVANFVGQWAPTILLMGLYNKLVKIEHELMSQRSSTR